MSIELAPLLAIFTLHLLGDFFCQTDWMALNKSKSWFALWIHAFMYSLVLSPMGFGLGGWVNWFFVVTLVTHFVTDAITSRITSKLWQAGKRHWFFVVIGIDQWIHAVTLVLTYVLLKG